MTFSAGVTIVSFDVLIHDDNTMEGNENFNLSINSSSLPDGVTVGDPGQVTVIILDDECKYVPGFIVHICDSQKIGTSNLSYMYT